MQESGLIFPWPHPKDKGVAWEGFSPTITGYVIKYKDVIMNISQRIEKLKKHDTYPRWLVERTYDPPESENWRRLGEVLECLFR